MHFVDDYFDSTSCYIERSGEQGFVVVFRSAFYGLFEFLVTLAVGSDVQAQQQGWVSLSSGRT